jgi:NAD(P) transhydrogenase subunit alpha
MWVLAVAMLASPLCQRPVWGQAEKPLSNKELIDAPSPSDGAVEPDSKDVAKEVQAEPVDRSAKDANLLIASLTIFLLAIFVGFEVITKVPPTLHTPLMSGSNAISGITIVGALIVAGHSLGFASFLGFIAVILATINVVGGFLVTHRMLAMFKKR